MNIYNAVSFFGMFIIVGCGALMSADRKKLNWQLIGWGFVLQLLLAVFVFVLPAGRTFFLLLNDVVVKVLDSAAAGGQFVFGRLALPPGGINAAGETSLGFILAFQALPTIIFFSSLISILYFFNIMPRIIRVFAFVFARVMKISGAESVVAASNIFVGVESALTVKPHLKNMTRSELCTVLSVGMATIASNVLALYVFFLREQFPSIAAHLISASILSAPAALVMSKIILPEMKKPETYGVNIHPHYEKDANLFEAIINGAQTGVKMIVGIVAVLIAVLGLVALFDAVLMFIGSGINSVMGFDFEWSLSGILGYMFYPFAVVLGVPLVDVPIVAQLIGERVVVTELVAYQHLAGVIARNQVHHARSVIIASYALCGFAHCASMAIFVGGLSALVPERTKEISEVALRALCAATLACLLTGCIAGTFFMENSILFSGIQL